MIMHQGHAHGAVNGDMARKHYAMLGLNLIVSGIVMYFVMYTMIDTTADLYNNLNNLYMTAMMVTSMAVLMLWMMRGMYPNRRLNILLYASFALIFILSFAGMRTQAMIGDRQFLRSMIPHHSGAVLMCEKSALADPEILDLCRGIVRSQAQEIAQMKAILERLKRD
jgi:uncharacterized protein (DUF305 family)